eukprot:173912_1
MDGYFKDLSHLIFHSVKKTWSQPKDNKNVIKTRIFPIFPRLKQVVIISIEGKYSFNWLEFLGEIQRAKSSIKQTVVKDNMKQKIIKDNMILVKEPKKHLVIKNGISKKKQKKRHWDGIFFQLFLNKKTLFFCVL